MTFHHLREHWRRLVGTDRSFPTRERRGKVHHDRGLTTAQLLKALRAGQQPKGIK